MSAIENLRDDVNELSDAIWGSIDHNDPSSLEQGFKFKQAFNDRWRELDQAAQSLWELLREQRLEESETPVVSPQPKADRKPKTEKIRLPKSAKAAAKGAGPSDSLVSEAEEAIEQEFREKTPFGFILGTKTFTSPANWALFYQIFLQELYKQAPETFGMFPDNKAWRDAGGKPLFSDSAEPLRRPLEVAERYYAEADLPLSLMVASMRRLARELQVPPDSLKILLKEDRRGTVETRPLAA